MKEKLVLVYADYGACNILHDPKSPRITAKALDGFVEHLAIDADSVRKNIFLDARGVEQEDGAATFNDTLIEWSNYTRHTCPRMGNFKKESIDATMIAQIHKDFTDFRKAFDLHILLVIGDVDYRPMILSLLNEKIKVSIIATKPHSTLHYSVLNRCHACYATFEIDDAHARIFKPFDAAMFSIANQPGNFQATYRPTREQVEKAIAYSGTQYICPECGHEVMTGNLRAHPCHKIKGTAQGLLTAPYVHELADALARYSTIELLEYLIRALHDQVLPHELKIIFENMPHIKWNVVETATLAHKIAQSGIIGLPVDSVNPEHVKSLAHAGVIQRFEDRYMISTTTSNYSAIRPLIEEVFSRLHYPNAMKIFAPEGVIKAERLRERLIEQLRTPQYFDIPVLDHTDPQFWDSDISLVTLSSPTLESSQRNKIRHELADLHPFVFWTQKMLSMSSRIKHDLLDTLEDLATQNPFITERSVHILVANGVLQFNPERELLIVNTAHNIFIPFDNQAVA